MSSTAATTASPGEVYFVSHGGPPTMFDSESKAYQAWKKIGPKIVAGKPKGLVVISAHWENKAPTSDVTINVDAANPLIYDFYNFPKHFYAQTFESSGSPELVTRMQSALKEGGIASSTEKRGPDHGVWVPLKIAFDGKTDIPLVQVSLPGDNKPESSASLGRALARLRNDGYTVLATGQVVHNLRDLFSGRGTPYSAPFLQATKEALASPDPVDSTANLTRHPLYKNAHPTDEHFLPLVVAVAAADADDTKEEIYVAEDGLGWGMWRWSRA